jgi:hypothetical protein
MTHESKKTDNHPNFQISVPTEASLAIVVLFAIKTEIASDQFPLQTLYQTLEDWLNEIGALRSCF